MKIRLKAPFNPAWIDVETQSAMLDAVLNELSANVKLTTIEFFDRKSGEVYPDCDIYLNGQPYSALADGLDTRLEDGDEIEIIMIILSGG